MKTRFTSKELRKRRSRAKIFGTAAKPRFSVFRSHRWTYAQLIDDEQGRTLLSGRAPAGVAKAKELGTLLAGKAKAMKIEQAVFHRGHYQYHGRVKAVAEGARAAGLKI